MEDANINFVNEIAGSLEVSIFTAGIFGDLSRAFDCVDHFILVEKLKKLNEKCFSLIKSYLQNQSRKTIVYRGNATFLSN